MSSSKRSTIIVEQLRKQQMLEALSRGKRLDGRNFDSYRDLEIEIGIIDKASGSARVKLGNTEVIAGIKVETGEPFEGLENKGALIMSAEVLPTASAHVEPGPPDEDAIELSRVVNRGDVMPPPITTIPISVTAVRIGDSVLLDPTMEEEACMDARLTIATQSDGDFVALQKGYAGPFTISQILQSGEIAR